jgi:hypothetical protein
MQTATAANDARDLSEQYNEMLVVVAIGVRDGVLPGNADDLNWDALGLIWTALGAADFDTLDPAIESAVDALENAASAVLFGDFLPPEAFDWYLAPWRQVFGDRAFERSQANAAAAVEEEVRDYHGPRVFVTGTDDPRRVANALTAGVLLPNILVTEACRTAARLADRIVAIRGGSCRILDLADARRVGDIAAVITNATANDVVFIPDLDRLSHAMLGVLMMTTERKLVVTIGTRKRGLNLTLAPFTLVAVTPSGTVPEDLSGENGVHWDVQMGARECGGVNRLLSPARFSSGPDQA